jgi:hypothetical protein
MTAAIPPLAGFIFDGARALGTTIEEAPPAWTGFKFNTELLARMEPVSSADRANRDLPRAVGAARFDRMPVLLGALDAAASTRRGLQDTLRRYRNQAAIARSWLADEAPNLQLFLIGPIGSAGVSNWRQLAAEAEADDRICRKLVWLPQSQPTIEDAESFLGRTFLAKPWISAPDSQFARLDGLGTIELPDGWQDAIDDEQLDADALVEKLVASQADDP